MFDQTEAFRALDPTEKGAVSYFLGMAVCKLFAARLLSTPWLLHLDVFRERLNPTMLGGRSRPDLVGHSLRQEWHAFETKGRSGGPNTDDKLKAKVQAQRLVSVNGIACSLHIGSFSYFRQEELQFYWCDPEPEEPEKLDPIEVRVSDDDWAFYYGPAVSLASAEGSEFLATRTSDLDVKVEIHPSLRGLLLNGQWAAARVRATDLTQMLREDGFHADGIRVLAGDTWSRRWKGAPAG